MKKAGRKTTLSLAKFNRALMDRIAGETAIKGERLTEQEMVDITDKLLN